MIENLLDNICFILYYNHRIPPNGKDAENVCFEVNFYYKADGSCPVRDFLDTLDDKMLAKLLGTISLLEANGTQLREPYSKSLGDGIFELRAKQSSNITRILYFS